MGGRRSACAPGGRGRARGVREPGSARPLRPGHRGRRASGAAAQPTRLPLHEGRADVHAMLGDFERRPRRLRGGARAWRTRPPSPLAEARVLGALAGLWGGHKDYDRGLALSREAVAAAERRGRQPGGAQRVSAEGAAARRAHGAQPGAHDGQPARADPRPRPLPGGRRRGRRRARPRRARHGAHDRRGPRRRPSRTPGRPFPASPEAGDRHTEASCLSNLAWALLYRGRRAEGEPGIVARSRGSLGRSAPGRRRRMPTPPGASWSSRTASGAAPSPRARPALAIARELGHREWTAAALSVARARAPELRRRRRGARVPRGDAGHRARAAHHAVARRRAERARPGPGRRGRDRRRRPPPRRGDPGRPRSRAVHGAARRRPDGARAPDRPARRSARPPHAPRAHRVPVRPLRARCPPRGGRSACRPRSARRGRSATPGGEGPKRRRSASCRPAGGRVSRWRASSTRRPSGRGPAARADARRLSRRSRPG